MGGEEGIKLEKCIKFIALTIRKARCILFQSCSTGFPQLNVSAIVNSLSCVSSFLFNGYQRSGFFRQVFSIKDCLIFPPM